MSGPSLAVLVVCTANICRSPMAEGLFRHRAAEQGIPIEVSSAGFMFDGEPATADAVAVMHELGVDISAHRSRLVTPEMVGASTLIVTMERTHARSLAVDVPEAESRIHTLGAASRDLGAIDAGPIETRVDLLGQRRSANELLGRGADEVDDPYGRPRRTFRRTAEHLDELVSGLLVAISAG